MHNIDSDRTQMLFMLRETRRLVQKHNDRRGSRRLYTPKIRWRKWLSSDDQDEEALPVAGRQAARKGRSDISADDPVEDHDGEGEAILSRRKISNDEEATGGPGLQYDLLGDTRTASPQTEAPDRESVPRDKEKNSPQPQSDLSLKNGPTPIQKTRILADDLMNWAHDSEDLAYALKLTIAAALVFWPAFVPGMNAWYNRVHGCE